MRKINFSIVVLAALLLATGFVFTACENSTGGGGGGSPKDILDGTTWEQLTGSGIPTGGLRLTFTAPNFVCRMISNNTVASSGTYSVKDNSFSGTITGGQSGSGTFNGTISGNTLSYNSSSTNGGNMSGTMTKK
jgi:hypothetical protein